MQEARFDVVWPSGRARIDEVAPNERPNDLSGTTIALIWDNLFKGPEMFELIQERLDATYVGIRYVDHTAFGNIHGTDAQEKAALAEIPELLREHKIDAVLVAVGA